MQQFLAVRLLPPASLAAIVQITAPSLSCTFHSVRCK
jgi:hypothetical protein